MARQVEELLKGFNIAPMYYDKNDDLDLLGAIFMDAEIITIHLEENEETKNLIADSLFRRCKRKPLFVNTSRASIVNPKSLLLAYRTSMIKGFALDVVEGYSIKDIQKLNDYGIITPHIAGKSDKSREATDKYVLEKLHDELRELTV